MYTYRAEIAMVLTGQELPPQADGSGFIMLAMFFIRSSCNGSLESSLWAMAATGVDCGVLTETKITNNIYTQFSLGYNAVALNAVFFWHGGIALFWIWRDNDLYEVKKSKICSP
jgi:hypothetical protein